ncbi:MAG: histidine phosphatase family protein [Patescibacteria group bacterium]
MEFRESSPEKIETEVPFETDMKVDFIRHGKPEYTDEEMRLAIVEGNLTEEGIEQVKNRALELAGKIDKEKELVVFWVSPKRRAQQTAEVLFGVFQEQGIPVIRDLKTIKSLTGVKVTPEFIENLMKMDSGKWMEYWTVSDLPEGTETPEEVKKRVERVVAYLERIARNITPPEGKKLHFICVGHEEIFMDLLQEGYGPGVGADIGPTYGEVMSMDIKKSEQGQDAVLKLKYRNQETSLDFNKENRKFYRETQ